MSRRFESEKRRHLISEEEARRLLARAVEIEAREGAYLSLEELREIALEAGIPLEALEQALGELEQGALRPPTVGRFFAEKLERSRSLACALGFFGAAMVTPGDAVTLTLLGGLSFFGLWEGMIALARSFGAYSPPSGPSSAETMDSVSRRRSDPGQDRRGIEFSVAMVLRGAPHVG
jgi:hypothetical protein